MTSELRSTVALALALAMSAFGMTALVAAERAGAEVTAGGTTRLELAPGLFKTLKANDVHLGMLGNSVVAGRFVSLPVIGGNVIDVATGEGAIESLGGFRLRAGKQSVKVGRITLDTSKGELRANIGGSKFEIASLQGFGFRRGHFTDVVETGRLRLNRRACSLLNRKLGVSAFRPSRGFGSVLSRVHPDLVQMAGGNFKINFDPGIVAKTRDLGLELRPFETTGSSTEPPSYTGPLIYGSVDPLLVRTYGAAEGGFSIATADGPGPQVFWFNLGISLETGKLLSNSTAHDEYGQLGPAPPAPLATVDAVEASSLLSPARLVVVSNAKAILEPSVAQYLNKTFAEPKGRGAIFAAGEPLGTVSMTIQGR